jgi:hypothetical protein
MPGAPHQMRTARRRFERAGSGELELGAQSFCTSESSPRTLTPLCDLIFSML